jgi:flagellar protein FlbT
MALTIRLRPKEKLIVNGAVLQNDSAAHAVTLLALNRINFIREREVVLPEDAVTPLLKVIYWLQLAYIDPDHREESGQQFMTLARALYEDKAMAEPNIRYALASAIGYAANGQIAAGLKALRTALPYERALLGIPEPGDGAPGNARRVLATMTPAGAAAGAGLDPAVVEEQPHAAESGASVRPRRAARQRR